MIKDIKKNPYNFQCGKYDSKVWKIKGLLNIFPGVIALIKWIGLIDGDLCRQLDGKGNIFRASEKG